MSKQRIVITANKTRAQYWRDLWQYRELFYFLAWRDFLVRYKQTVIGVIWSIFRPFVTLLVLTVVFGELANLDTGEVPYPILVFAGLLPWQFFSNALSGCSESLVSNSNLVSEIYFPRLIIPASSILVSFIDFLISFLILLGLMAWFNYPPSWRFLTLPLFIGIAIIVSFGGGLWMAALNVKYRDFGYIVPYIVQFGLYISPVGFSSDIVPDEWRLVYSLNPMVGVIDGFRWAILGKGLPFYWPGFSLSMVFIFALFSSGIWYFRKTERTFADFI